MKYCMLLSTGITSPAASRAMMRGGGADADASLMVLAAASADQCRSVRAAAAKA